MALRNMNIFEVPRQNYRENLTYPERTQKHL